MKRVVIVGGGFAGARLARKLSKNKKVVVTLVNPSMDFKYAPALYRAATGYKMGTARLSLEWMLLDAQNLSIVIDRAVSVSPEKKSIGLASGKKLSYDYAVFALGSETTYFNIEGLHEHSYGVKSSEEVIYLREHIHDRVVNHPEEQSNYVVVGAGPTGVELSAALGDYVQRIYRHHKKKQSKVAIWLVEAGGRVIPQMNEKASVKIHNRLRKLGVEILTSTMVKGEKLHSLTTSAGNIKTDTVIWTAGTMTNSFYASHKKHFTFSPRGKIKVNRYLETRSGIYVIGDNAETEYSGLALTAIWHADFVAKDIKRRLYKKKRRSYKEKRPVQVVPVGRNWAALQYGKINVFGFFVSLIRKAADYVGYGDVMGYLRAVTIWSNSEKEDSTCDVCRK